MQHLTERLMRQFLFGQATKEEAQAVVRHLLTRCQHCATMARLILARECSPRLISFQILSESAERLPYSSSMTVLRAGPFFLPFSAEVLLMTEAEAVAQAQLDIIVRFLETARKALQSIDATLPPSPQEESQDDRAEDAPDVTSEVRRVVQCVLTDRIDAAIRELTAASIYKPFEPEPGEEPGK